MKTKYLLPIILSTLTIVSCGSSSKEETKPGGEGEIGNPIQSIDILHNPTKTEYIVGDFFEPDGLILTATYMDQKTSSISYDSNKQYFTFSIGLDTPLTLEDTTVTITYMSMTADISITVVEESEPEEETETYIVDFNSFVFSVLYAVCISARKCYNINFYLCYLWHNSRNLGKIFCQKY